MSEAHLKRGVDMTKEEKLKNVDRVLCLPDFRGNEFLEKFQKDSIEKRVERLEKMLAFIGAFEKWEEE